MLFLLNLWSLMLSLLTWALQILFIVFFVFQKNYGACVSVCCNIPSWTSHAVCTAQVLRPVRAVCYDRSQSSVLMSGSGRVRSCGRSSCSASTFRDNCIAPPTERSRGCVSVWAGPAVACAAAFARCSLRVCRFFIIFNSLGLRRYLDLVTIMKLVLINLCAEVEVN